MLLLLVEHVDILPLHRPDRPYYQRRLREQCREPDDWEPSDSDLLPIFFVQLYEDLDQRGYFVRAFGGDCKNGAPSDISGTRNDRNGLGVGSGLAARSQ